MYPPSPVVVAVVVVAAAAGAAAAVVVCSLLTIPLSPILRHTNLSCMHKTFLPRVILTR